MAFLNQSRFPTAWRIFQFFIGGVIDKRKFAIMHYQGEKRVLEVGCSLGNVSSVFTQYPEIEFTGVDIDPVVITYSQKSFKNFSNFSFICADLRDYAKLGKKFDLILFPGILHHVDDQLAIELLESATTMLAKDAPLIVIDPVLPEKSDPLFHHLFLKLEQGQYLRYHEQMITLLGKVKNTRLTLVEKHLMGATPLSIPKSCTFGIYKLTAQ